MFTSSLFALIFSPLVTSYLVSPPGTPYPEASADCSGWVEGSKSLTCATIEATYSISASDFEAWNPLAAAAGTCTLVAGFYYCVQINYGNTNPNTTTTLPSTISSPTATTGDGISTPTPHQTGIASNCNKFYLVVSGDECGTIASQYGISLGDFYSWNPAVGANCQYLGLGDYVCVDIIGFTPTGTTLTTTTTSPGDGITTPTPYQPGMASNCVQFHLVSSGDQCGLIASQYGITLSQFYAWNPAVGSSCAYLDLGDYVCVAVLGATSITSPPPTGTGNGITTPTPYQSGMASNCDTFHFVVSGDQCGLIASQYGISLNQFYTWNPAVGSSCQYLDLGDYVCVDVIGATGVTTTTTPTTGPNGVVTPTPYQPGMTTNCDAFHYVISGDQCGNIASQYGVSLTQFYAWNPAVGSSCQYLDLGDYVCVGILG